MSNRVVRRWSLVVLVTMFVTLIAPGRPLTVAAAAVSLTNPVPLPVISPRTIAPLVLPQQAVLALALRVSPHTLVVGETATITVTVRNTTGRTATDVAVMLPLPAGGTAVADAAYQPVAGRWRWTFSQLAAFETRLVTAQVRVTSLPRGAALLATAQVTAATSPAQSATSGALVVARPSQVRPTADQFVPGVSAVIDRPSAGIQVTVAPDAATQPLILQAQTATEQQMVAPNTPPLPTLTYGRQGLMTYFLTAATPAGKAVTTFAAPVTITLGYTPEQLTAFGIADANLTIFWLDEALNRWIAQPTVVDPIAHTATTVVNHFSAYQLGDGSKPSDAFIPSLQGWQVGLYTGGVNYSYPIDVPAGPAGVKPNFDLSYNSSGEDGADTMTLRNQAGWVGKGWSLDPGSVALNDIGDGTESIYSMSVNGMSFDLVRTVPLVQGAVATNPSDWEWRSTNETFVRVRATVQPYQAGRGINWWGAWRTRYKWTLWTKDGTRYEFAEDMWRGFVSCPISVSGLEAYRWMLSNSVDVHGNVIRYAYTRTSYTVGDVCPSYGHPQGTVDAEITLSEVTWGGDVTTGNNPRYRAVFTSHERVLNNQAIDTQVPPSPSQMGGPLAQPQQTRILRQISIESNPNAAWNVVRQYRLDYADPSVSLTPDRSVCTARCDSNYLNADYAPEVPDTSYRKVTLTSITRVGNDGTSVLPETTFGYGGRGTNYYPAGGWNRLTTVNNGQGGTLAFAYDLIAQTPGTAIPDFFFNYHRVATKTVNDGQRLPYVWQYAYQNPAFNTVGTLLDSYSTQTYPNSAVLYVNEYGDPLHDRSLWLMDAPRTEFRGHRSVIETAPNGTQTEHWFYQGDVGCYPSRTQGGIGVNYTPGDELTYETIYTNPCFLQLRERELLKGKEYRTQVRNSVTAGNGVFHDTTTSFGMVWYGNGGDGSPLDLAGLWRAFTYTTETTSTTWEGATALTKRTKSFYDQTWQGGTQYGNLTKTEEYDGAGVLYRSTESLYDPLVTDTSYVVDRKRNEAIRSGDGKLVAATNYFYDGNTSQNVVGPRGLLTLTRTFSNITPAYVYGVTTLDSVDTRYQYDAYGNQTHVTTYAAQGFRAGTNTWSAPGNGSVETTTIMEYDGIFHVFVEKVTSPPAIVGAAPLIELSGYHLRMGTLTSATGPNGTATTVSAEYDVFGRLRKIIKPGDTSALPTVEALYDDYAVPFRYIVAQREVSGQGGNQPTMSFYDGMGRVIQTKSEVLDGAQTVVTNTEYDGMNNVLRAYRPRLVDETPSTTFWNYLPPVVGLPATSTTYDAKSRPLVVTHPDAAQTGYVYEIGNAMHLVNTIDANHHRTQQRSDVFGRLREVLELNGTCGNYWSSYSCGGAYTTPWTVAATTRYAYSPLDLLTTATDAQNNVTTMTYDSLGRKRTMNDPDMGAWSYSYDPDGNLVTQTDAKNQTITFGYDNLSRLRSKVVPGTGTVTYTYDQTDLPKHRYGLGQRTSMSDVSGTQDWGYNQRGLVNHEEHTGDGTTRVIDRTYRADEQVNTLTQPTGETLTYGYNAARQQTTISTSLGGQYLTTTTYDALGQTLVEVYGNGVNSTHTYYASSARLYNIIVRGPQSQTLFRRYYTYDGVGNVRTTDSPEQAETLRFGYDDRDRLTSACAVANVNSTPCVGGTTFNQTYAYNTIGNLTNKAGVAYTYPSNGVRPHAVATVAGQAYTYDGNGNVLTGGGRSYTWNAENQPTQITSGGTTEMYQYNGDNTRIKKTSTSGGVSVTTRYVGDIEYRSDGTTITNYGVAFRTRTATTNVLTYVHGDHLGSVSLTTNATGVASPLQTFDPWGAVRSGAITGAEWNYTNQRKDAGTGLLFYNARYYDPALGRFLSADTIGVNRSDPQTRNRYSYVLNNPLKYTDPTGHCADADVDEIAECAETLDTLGQYGITVVNAWQDWTFGAIQLLLTALYDLIRVAGWDHVSPTDVKNILTNNGAITAIYVYRGGANGTGAGVLQYRESDRSAHITLWDAAFETGRRGDPADDMTKRTFVHELAHVWDFANGGSLSQGIETATGGATLDDGTYHVGGHPASSYAEESREEDFAESVAASVYPDMKMYTHKGKRNMDRARRLYIRRAFCAEACVVAGK